MNMRKSIKTFLIASSVALAVPMAAHARGGMDWGGEGGGRCEAGMMKHHGGHHGDHMMRGMRGLDLSDAQRDQIFELKHALAPKMREEIKAVRAARAQLRDMAMSDSYEEAKVKELTEARAAAMARMAQLKMRNQHEIQQVLTPEQREQLKQRAQKVGEKKGKRMQDKGGRMERKGSPSTES